MKDIVGEIDSLHDHNTSRLLRSLSPQQLKLWRLVYDQGMSFGSVARTLGISKRNVRTQWERINEKAKQMQGL